MCSNRYPALPAMYRSTSTRAVQLATGLCHAFQESHFTRLRSARNPYLDPAGGEAEADIQEAIFGVTLAEQQKPGIDHGKLGPFSRAAWRDLPRLGYRSAALLLRTAFSSLPPPVRVKCVTAPPASFENVR